MILGFWCLGLIQIFSYKNPKSPSLNVTTTLFLICPTSNISPLYISLPHLSYNPVNCPTVPGITSMSDIVKQPSKSTVCLIK